METTKGNNYAAPDVKVYLVKPATIICQSGGGEEGGGNEEYGYGGKL